MSEEAELVHAIGQVHEGLGQRGMAQVCYDAATRIEALEAALQVIGFSKLSLSPQADEENRRHARTALSTPDSKGSGT